MQPTQLSQNTVPTVVRLGLVATLFVMGIRLVFVGLQGVLNLWIALTPGQDRAWQAPRTRV